MKKKLEFLINIRVFGNLCDSKSIFFSVFETFCIKQGSCYVKERYFDSVSHLAGTLFRTVYRVRASDGASARQT